MTNSVIANARSHETIAPHSTTQYFVTTIGTQACKIAYETWGDKSKPAVFCIHGITRSRRDFAVLAQKLASQFYVIAADMPGRAESDRLKDKTQYHFLTYVDVIEALLASLNIERTSIIGTSMGGMVGMIFAAEYAHRVEKLVMNDIGPVIPHWMNRQIAHMIRMRPNSFTDIDEVIRYLKTVNPGFNPATENQWLQLALGATMQNPASGTYELNYDPDLTKHWDLSMRGNFEVWEIWEKVSCPTLVLRGEHSPLLTPFITERMHVLNPNTKTKVMPGFGHAPHLMNEEDSVLIGAFLQ